MPVSDATVFAASCRAEQREPLLSAMAAERAAQVRSRLQFPPDAVGRIMEPMRHVVSERASPDQVRQTFSETGARYLYRVDTDGCLTGVVSRRGAPLKGSPLPMVESRALSIPARLSLDAVRGHPGWEEVDAMPVVDSGNRLIGVVRHKQVRRMARSEIHVVDEAVTGVDALISLGEAYCSGLWEIIGPLTVAERISPGGDGGDK
jgi:Mg/Co/Ni transporter MgtE